jgi:hypothetical protein
LPLPWHYLCANYCMWQVMTCSSTSDKWQENPVEEGEPYSSIAVTSHDCMMITPAAVYHDLLITDCWCMFISSQTCMLCNGNEGINKAVLAVWCKVNMHQ